MLSIRARYGAPDTGVRGAVARYRAAAGGRRLDNLTCLAEFLDQHHLASPDSSRLADLLANRQTTGGVPKVDAITAAAVNLGRPGVAHAADLDSASPAHRRAYCTTRGLGPVIWHYFTMLLGHHPGVKADTCVTRFAADALGRPVTAEETHALVVGAAHRLDRSPTDLDNAIWSYMRTQ